MSGKGMVNKSKAWAHHGKHSGRIMLAVLKNKETKKQKGLERVDLKKSNWSSKK